MAESTNMQQVLFTTLRLLGLDVAANEKALRIPFNKDMFNLPNKKGFECVMHFLFSKLDANKCKEDFKNCWPVGDKKDEAMFRRVCNGLLTNIAKNDANAHLPLIVPSLFMSPGGEKFTRFLFSFSNYVLHKTITDQFGVNQRQFLRHPILNPQSLPLGAVVAEGLMCGMVRHRKAFVDHAQDVSHLHDQWRAEAKELVKTYRNLTKNIRELERQVQMEIQNAVSSSGSPIARRHKSGSLEYNFDSQSVKRAAKVQKLRDNWKQVTSFSQSQTKAQEVLGSVIDGSEEKHCIDANQINIKVPDLLLQQCERELHRRNVSNVYHGGKLNLLSLLHLWNLSLHLYIEKLHQEGVPSFDHLQPVISSHADTCKAHLSTTQNLKTELVTDVLPTLHKSIRDLQHKLDASIFQGGSPSRMPANNNQHFFLLSNPKIKESLGLWLMPPTPPYVFGPMNTPQDKKFCLSSKFSEKQNVPTPEAALQVLRDVRSKVNSASPLVLQGNPVYGPHTSPADHLKKPSQLPQQQKYYQKSHNNSTAARNDSSFISSKKCLNQPPKPSLTVRKTFANRRRYAKNEPNSSSSSDPKSPPGYQNQAADKIVAAVLGGEGSSPGNNLFSSPSSVHSVETSDREAFVVRDKLGRTPAPATHHWHRKLKSSVHPLSSTQIEHSEEEAKHHANDGPSLLDTSSSNSPYRGAAPSQLNMSSTWLSQQSRESSPCLPQTLPLIPSLPSSIHSNTEEQSLARVLDFEDIASQTSVDDFNDKSGDLLDLTPVAPCEFESLDDEFQTFATFTQTPQVLRQHMQEALSEDQPIEVVEYENGSFNKYSVRSPIREAEIEDSLLKNSHIEAGLRLTQNLEAELESWRQKGLVTSNHEEKSLDDIRARFNRLKVSTQEKAVPESPKPVSVESPRSNSVHFQEPIGKPDLLLSPLTNLLHDEEPDRHPNRMSLGPGILDLDFEDSFLVPSSPIEIQDDV